MAMMAILITIVATAGWPVIALAQTTIKIVATVDGAPITSHDVAQRRNMLVKVTGLKLTEDTSQQINRDVLQMLIDDQIKIQEGERLFSDLLVQVDARADLLVNETFAQSGQDADQVLRSLKIPREVIRNKFKADVLWASTIKSQFSTQFSNAETEAASSLKRLKENLEKPHVNLDEIVLVPEQGRSLSATRNLAEQIITAIRDGADFGRIAQQYSVSGSGRNGGNLGWAQLDRFHPEIRDVLANLKIGEIAPLLEHDGMVFIYRMRGLRQNGQPDPMEAVIELGRVLIPTNVTDDAAKLEAAARMTRDTAGISTCADLEALHQSYGSSFSFLLGEIALYDLSPRMRELLSPMKAGEITKPITFTEGIAAFMLCSKTVPQLTLPSHEQLVRNVEDKYFSVLSTKHLEKLRRLAVIDIRESY